MTTNLKFTARDTVRKRSIALVLFGLAAAGCGAAQDPEQHRVTSTGDEQLVSQALIGGTPTTARPEVGVISSASGWCTATLIGERWVLTAAHCNDYKTGPFTGEFTMDGRAPVPVVNFVAWGSSVGIGDVGIAELARPVPRSVATPARVTAISPKNGEIVTTIGYGCDDRGTRTGRAREYITRPFGESNFSCPGDSGGPTFFGPITGQGPISMVTSGYAWWPFDWDDKFGSAARFKGRIRSRLRGSFNGDRFADLMFVEPSNNSLHVINSTGSGFVGGAGIPAGTFGNVPSNYIIADFTGDGLTDIGFHADDNFWVAANVGNGYGGPNTKLWSAKGQFGSSSGGTYLAGDFNGDLMADLAWWHPGTGQFWVNISTGSGLFGPGTGLWAPSFGNSSGQLVVGDFNGDGLDDIAFNQPVPGGRYDAGTIHVALSTGVGLGAPGSGPWESRQEWYRTKLIVGDFNGDGRDDLVGATTGNGLIRSFSDGTAFVYDGILTWRPKYGAVFSYQSLHAADYDGDSDDDLLLVENGELKLLVPDGTGHALVTWLAGWGHSAGRYYDSTGHLLR